MNRVTTITMVVAWLLIPALATQAGYTKTDSATLGPSYWDYLENYSGFVTGSSPTTDVAEFYAVATAGQGTHAVQAFSVGTPDPPNYYHIKPNDSPYMAGLNNADPYANLNLCGQPQMVWQWQFYVPDAWVDGLQGVGTQASPAEFEMRVSEAAQVSPQPNNAAGFRLVSNDINPTQITPEIHIFAYIKGQTGVVEDQDMGIINDAAWYQAKISMPQCDTFTPGIIQATFTVNPQTTGTPSYQTITLSSSADNGFGWFFDALTFGSPTSPQPHCVTTLQNICAQAGANMPILIDQVELLGGKKSDSDQDGVFNFEDNCPNDVNPNQEDADGDDVGDACEADTDSDGVPDDSDNCVNTPNAGQQDADGDDVGDACEGDADGDGEPDDTDNCVNTPNAGQEDADGDDVGDACEGDSDGDGVADDTDNCPDDPNTGQEDTDSDGIGDACEGDDDADGIENGADNCPDDANPLQEDFDADGEGNACDDTPNGQLTESPCPVPVTATELVETFEDETLGQNPDACGNGEWYTYYEESVFPVVGVNPEGDGLILDASGQNPAGVAFIPTKPTVNLCSSKTRGVQVDLRNPGQSAEGLQVGIHSTNTNFGTFANGAGGSSLYVAFPATGGVQLRYYQASGAVTATAGLGITTIPVDTWFRLRIEVDCYSEQFNQALLGATATLTNLETGQQFSGGFTSKPLPANTLNQFRVDSTLVQGVRLDNLMFFGVSGCGEQTVAVVAPPLIGAAVTNDADCGSDLEPTIITKEANGAHVRTYDAWSMAAPKAALTNVECDTTTPPSNGVAAFYSDVSKASYVTWADCEAGEVDEMKVRSAYLDTPAGFCGYCDQDFGDDFTSGLGDSDFELPQNLLHVGNLASAKYDYQKTTDGGAFGPAETVVSWAISTGNQVGAYAFSMDNNDPNGDDLELGEPVGPTGSVISDLCTVPNLTDLDVATKEGDIEDFLTGTASAVGSSTKTFRVDVGFSDFFGGSDEPEIDFENVGTKNIAGTAVDCQQLFTYDAANDDDYRVDGHAVVAVASGTTVTVYDLLKGTANSQMLAFNVPGTVAPRGLSWSDGRPFLAVVTTDRHLYAYNLRNYPTTVSAPVASRSWTTGTFADVDFSADASAAWVFTSTEMHRYTFYGETIDPATAGTDTNGAGANKKCVAEDGHVEFVRPDAPCPVGTSQGKTCQAPDGSLTTIPVEESCPAGTVCISDCNAPGSNDGGPFSGNTAATSGFGKEYPEIGLTDLWCRILGLAIVAACAFAGGRSGGGAPAVAVGATVGAGIGVVALCLPPGWLVVFGIIAAAIVSAKGSKIVGG